MTSGELARRVIWAAREKNVILTTVESCTGGLLAAALTAIPGASRCFQRGHIVYSDAAKVDVLGVDPSLIDRHGAVSAQVAMAMAIGALDQSAAGLAVSVTGIAGPSGGSAKKPVGTVYLAAAPGGVVRKHVFADLERDAVRQASVNAALALFAELLRMRWVSREG